MSPLPPRVRVLLYTLGAALALACLVAAAVPSRDDTKWRGMFFTGHGVLLVISSRRFRHGATIAMYHFR